MPTSHKPVLDSFRLAIQELSLYYPVVRKGYGLRTLGPEAPFVDGVIRIEGKLLQPYPPVGMRGVALSGSHSGMQWAQNRGGACERGRG
jgi:hypothetical protein